MMSDVQISVGDLSSFLIYAGFVGTSFRGEENKKIFEYVTTKHCQQHKIIPVT